MSKTFSEVSSEAFLNFTKSVFRRTKKNHQRVLTDCFEKNFEENTYLASQLVGTFQLLLNMGFHNKTACKNS